MAALKDLEIHKVFPRFFALPSAIWARESEYFGYWYSFLDQALQKALAKVTAAEAEAIFVKVGLEVLFGQAMVSTQDERLGVADRDVQPVEQTRILA